MDVRCRLVVDGGVPLHLVDEQEWWRISSLYDFWQNNPSTRQSLEAITYFLGVGPKKTPKMPSPEMGASVERPGAAEDNVGMAEFLAKFPDGRIRH